MLYPSPTSSQPSTTRFCLALGMGSHDPVPPNICHVAVVQGTNEQEETGHIDSGKKAQKEEQMAANMELRGEEKGGEGERTGVVVQNCRLLMLLYTSGRKPGQQQRKMVLPSGSIRTIAAEIYIWFFLTPNQQKD